MASYSFKRAHDLQAKAASVGFDWPDAKDMLDKLDEELHELRDALQKEPSGEAVSEEIGDILFVLVNLMRRLKLMPDPTLDAACDKFERRFGYICEVLAQRGQRPEQVGLDTLEALWLEAKQLERQQP